MLAGADPVRGCRILVTRASEGIEQWTERIEATGAEVVALPCIDCEPIHSATLGDQLAAAIADAEWLVLTSPRGAGCLAELLASDDERRRGTRIAVVGPATEATVRKLWGRIDLVAPEGSAASLADALIPLVGGDPAGRTARVVIVGPERPRPELEHRLREEGISMARFAVYRTVPVAPARSRQDLATWNLGAIFIASPSAVEGLLNQASVPVGVPLVSIGPTTTAAAAAAGLTVSSEATRRCLDGLIDALRETIAHVESCQ